MAGLIRCICGHMYDPDSHDSCPECGRARKNKKSANTATTPPPEPLATREGSASAEEPQLQSGDSPSWIPKLAAAAVGLLVIVVLINSFLGGDDTDKAPDQQTPNESSNTEKKQGSPPAKTKGKACEEALGQWRWYTGGFVTLVGDNTAHFKPTPQTAITVRGQWSCDPDTGTYSINWQHGYTDTMKVYGQSFRGTNNAGDEVSGTR